MPLVHNLWKPYGTYFFDVLFVRVTVRTLIHVTLILWFGEPLIIWYGCSMHIVCMETLRRFTYLWLFILASCVSFVNKIKYKFNLLKLFVLLRYNWVLLITNCNSIPKKKKKKLKLTSNCNKEWIDKIN